MVFIHFARREDGKDGHARDVAEAMEFSRFLEKIDFHLRLFIRGQAFANVRGLFLCLFATRAKILLKQQC